MASEDPTSVYDILSDADGFLRLLYPAPHWRYLTMLVYQLNRHITIPISHNNQYVTNDIRFKFSLGILVTLETLTRQVLSADTGSPQVELHEQRERLTILPIYKFLTKGYQACESPLEIAFLMALIAYDSSVLLAMIDESPKLKPQFLIGKYRVDFAYTDDDLKLVIELDGHNYHEKTPEQAARDRKRDRDLTAEGWKVIRFHSKEIKENLDQCAIEALKWMGRDEENWVTLFDIWG